MSVAVDAMPVQRGFWNGVGNAAKTVGVAIKDAALWCGRMVKVLFTDYIFPGIKKLWALVVTGMKHLWNFLKTAPGLGTLGFLFGLGVGFALLAAANKDSLKNNTITRVMLRIAAGLAFALGGAALALGVAACMR